MDNGEKYVIGTRHGSGKEAVALPKRVRRCCSQEKEKGAKIINAMIHRSVKEATIGTATARGDRKAFLFWKMRRWPPAEKKFLRTQEEGRGCGGG